MCYVLFMENKSDIANTFEGSIGMIVQGKSCLVPVAEDFIDAVTYLGVFGQVAIKLPREE